MATPKVFISSTCFDLGEIRDQLQKFVRSFGFEPILSEYGDIFYHPDLHTHESCVYEISNCQLFILIIGGRFGGQYISDKTKSITNAEYEAAKRQKIPIFSYVKSGVLSSHHVYKQNKDNDFVGKIEYPSIEKNEHALEIFRFIDEVRRAPNNNSLESFEKFTEIETHLRKQLAGMFFDFLKTREVKHQIDATNHLISGLASSNSKLEALVKSLYRELSTDSAEANIDEIEIKSKTESFFMDVLEFEENSPFNSQYPFPNNFNITEAASISPQNFEWYEYLVEIGLFHQHEPLGDDDNMCIAFHTEDYFFSFNHDNYPPISKLYEQGVRKSSQKQREEVLHNIFSRSDF